MELLKTKWFLIVKIQGLIQINKNLIKSSKKLYKHKTPNNIMLLKELENLTNIIDEISEDDISSIFTEEFSLDLTETIFHLIENRRINILQK